MINVTKSYLPNQDKYVNYVKKIYQSNHLTNNGPLVRELEVRLKEYLGVKNLILVSNGTIALNIAYLALGLSGEAVTTPFSFVATASSLCLNGIKPVFSDINNKTFNLSVQQIESKITQNTQLIVPVHVFGNPCEVEAIAQIANKHSLKVIYDAAHAFGTSYQGQSILNFGDVSTLSFHATKLFHTIEGGAIITQDDRLDTHMRQLINFGIQDEATIPHLGTNAKMNEFEAAMGLCVLDEIDIICEQRREIYEYYQRSLKDNFELQSINPNCQYNYSYFPVVVETEEKLLAIKSLLNNSDIYPRRYFYPSLDRLVFLNEPSSSTCPHARSISSRILCLPLYPGLDIKDQKRIVEIMKGVK